MMSIKLKWIALVLLLLNDQSFCKAAPPPAQTGPTLLRSQSSQEAIVTVESNLLPSARPISSSSNSRNLGKLSSADLIIGILSEKLQKPIRDRFNIQGNVTCAELLSATAVDDFLFSAFPRELLGLSLVPVLVVADCPAEARTAVLKLYDLLGQDDTHSLLMELEALIEEKMEKSGSLPELTKFHSESDGSERHMEAVMFNVQQLASAAGADPEDSRCEGWIRVNGTMLVGIGVRGATGTLQDALNGCERLGVQCAGVTSTGPFTPGLYRAVLRRGSGIFPFSSPESECWIYNCQTQNDISSPGAPGGRVRRSPGSRCVNKEEERVYRVVEWIPAVSTLYNLGSAVYYAATNCTSTAKQRAIYSAVDLGTDALMVATGGAAGVAGYALGAGVKTGAKAGVRHLFYSMKEEDDVLVNQKSWEEGVMTVQ